MQSLSTAHNTGAISAPKVCAVGSCCLLLIAALGCTGVYSRIALEAVRDERIPGEWQVEGQGDTMLIRLDAATGEYVAQPKDDPKEKPVSFRLARVGEALFVQSGAKPCESFRDEAECYSWARLELEGAGTARLFRFDTEALFRASLQEDFGIHYEIRRRVAPQSIGVAHETDFLLGGDQTAVRRFLAGFGTRFTQTEPTRYRRVATPKAR